MILIKLRPLVKSISNNFFPCIRFHCVCCFTFCTQCSMQTYLIWKILFECVSQKCGISCNCILYFEIIIFEYYTLLGELRVLNFNFRETEKRVTRYTFVFDFTVRLLRFCSSLCLFRRKKTHFRCNCKFFTHKTQMMWRQKRTEPLGKW